MAFGGRAPAMKGAKKIAVAQNKIAKLERSKSKKVAVLSKLNTRIARLATNPRNAKKIARLQKKALRWQRTITKLDSRIALARRKVAGYGMRV